MSKLLNIYNLTSIYAINSSPASVHLDSPTMKLLILFFLWSKFIILFSQHFEPPPTRVISELLGDGFSQQDVQAILQGDLEDVKQKLDDLQKHDSQKYNKLLELINSNKNQLVLLNRYTLAVNCGDAIGRGDFEKAKYLLKFVFASNYDEVIYKSYKNSSESFENVLEFSNFVYDPKDNMTYLLYQELFEKAMSAAAVDDFINMTTFIKELYNNSDWTDLKKQVLNVVVRKASADIRSYLTSGDEVKIVMSYNTMNKIYNCDHGAGSDLVMDIFDKIDDDVQLCHVLTFVSHINDEYLQMQGYLALKQYRQPGNCSIQFLDAIRESMKFIVSDADVRKGLTALVESFPDQVRAAAYSDKLCIRNVMSGHYLKMTNNTANGRWQIVVSPGEQVYERTKWFVVRTLTSSALIFFKNSFTNNFISWEDVVYDSELRFAPLPFEVAPWEEGVYIKIPNNESFLIDKEGFLQVDMDLQNGNNFAKWTFEAC